MRKHWKTERNAEGITRRGLDLARDPGLGPTTATELTQAIQAASEAHTAFVGGEAREATGEMRRRARVAIRELTQVCRWWAETEGSSEQIQTVRQLRDPTRASSQDALALSLYNWARLADEWRDRLRGVGGFDLGVIDSAMVLSTQLRKAHREPSPNPARLARDTLLRAIVEQVARIRRAARFVFANELEVVREVTSSWERRSRAKRRKTGATRANKAGSPAKADSPGVTR